MMDIHLVKACIEDCKEIHELQTKAFDELLKKYHDASTNPGAESSERITQKMEQPSTDFTLLELTRQTLGQ